MPKPRPFDLASYWQLSPEMERCLAALRKSQSCCLVQTRSGRWNIPENNLVFDFAAGTVRALEQRLWLEPLEIKTKERKFKRTVRLTFDNEDRRRSYGVRRGDRVKQEWGGLTRHVFRYGRVVAYGVMDNNSAYVAFDGERTISRCTAEELVVVERVEDQKPAAHAD